MDQFAVWERRRGPRDRCPAVVRAAGDEDVVAVAELSTMPGTVEERAGRLQRDVEAPDRDLFVATLDGAPVGYARLGLVPDGDSGMAPAGWYVLGLMVSPSARRLGVGGSLLRGVAERAALLGADELWSFTDVGNVVSQDLHRLVGFVEQRRGRIGFPGLPDDSQDVLLRLQPVTLPVRP